MRLAGTCLHLLKIGNFLSAQVTFSVELFPSLSAEDIYHFHRTVTHSVTVQSHYDALIWLQGDMQRYLPHRILVAAWGNFSLGAVQHDIVSALPGVRSINSRPKIITPLLCRLFSLWSAFDCRPLALDSREGDFEFVQAGVSCELGSALRRMHCAMVHGIRDGRGNQDCIYVIFSDKDQFTEAECSHMGLALPYVDNALRRIKHLPHQEGPAARAPTAKSTPAAQETEHDLSEREAQVLQWVTLGKTNPEIGVILDISEFTVKNHMQRIFKKLDVFSRAQAVGKFKSLVGTSEVSTSLRLAN